MDNINSEDFIINKLEEIERKILSEDISAENIGKSVFLLQFMLNNFSRRNESSEINTKIQLLINKLEKKQRAILHS